MLQAAIAVVHRVEQEDVAVEAGRRLAVPETQLRLADAARVGEQPFAIETRRRAGHHELVRHTAGLETAAPQA